MWVFDFSCRSTHGGSTNQQKSGVQLGLTMTTGHGSKHMKRNNIEVMVEILKEQEASMYIKASKLLQPYAWGRNYNWFSIGMYHI